MPVRNRVGSAGASGRVLPWLLGTSAAALAVGAGFFAHEATTDAGTLESGVISSRVERALVGLDQRVEDLVARLDELERRGPPIAVRSEELAPPGFDAGRTGDARESLQPAEADAAGQRNGRGRGGNDLGFEDMRRLHDAPDDVARLKIARELVASGNPMAAMGALRVLADLAPKEALALVDQWFEQSRKGEVPGWQLERGLATLVDSKGAEALGSELSATLRRYFREGGDDVKRSAARTLEKQGDSGPMEQLVASLSSDLGNSDVRRRGKSIDALGDTRSKTAAPRLVPLLADSSDEIRLRTLDALRRTGDETSIEKFLPLLNDPVAAVRDRATRTIESIRRGESQQDWRGGGGDGGFQFGGRRGGN